MLRPLPFLLASFIILPIISSKTAIQSSSTTSTSSPWINIFPDSNSSTVLAHREGAMVVSGPISDSLLVFGGCSSSCCYAPLNDLFLWSSSTTTNNNYQWYNLTIYYNTNTNIPTGRLYHTATIGALPTIIYMYGGADELIGARSDLWSLELIVDNNNKGNITNIRWTEISTNSLPGPRAAHSQVRANSNDGSFYIYGGENETNILNDIWYYNATNNSWLCIYNGIDNYIDSPQGRSQTGLTLISNNNTNTEYLVINGGTDNNGNDHMDIWVYNLQTNNWLCIGNIEGGGPDGNGPLERHGHATWTNYNSEVSSSSSSLSIYIFGGQHGSLESDPFVGDVWLFTAIYNTSINNYNNGTFTLIQKSNYQPNTIQPVARGMGGIAIYPPNLYHNHSSSIQDNNITRILYFGGFSGYNGGLNDLLHNDIWLFES